MDVSMSSPFDPEYFVVMNTSFLASPLSRTALPASSSLPYICAVSAPLHGPVSGLFFPARFQKMKHS